MATSKVQVPNPAIFQDDAQQQIYARGTLDRDMSGLSYMFKNAADTRRGQDQTIYMQGVAEANKIAAALAQQEDQQKMLIEAMKLVPDYAKAGVPIAQFPALAATSRTGGTDEQTADSSLLVNLLKRAQIADMNAKAAAAGQAGAPQVESTVDYAPGGASVSTTKVKGRDATAVMALQKKLAENDAAARQTYLAPQAGPNSPLSIQMLQQRQNARRGQGQ